MEYQLLIDPETEFVVVEVSGEAQPGEFIGLLTELWANEIYATASHVIWDLAQSQTNYFFDDVVEVVNHVKTSKKLRGPSTVAIVAPGDNEFGSSRVYATLSESNLLNINVFRERILAAEWLGNQVKSTKP